jgi:hypothetical protein
VGGCHQLADSGKDAMMVPPLILIRFHCINVGNSGGFFESLASMIAGLIVLLWYWVEPVEPTNSPTTCPSTADATPRPARRSPQWAENYGHGH